MKPDKAWVKSRLSQLERNQAGLSKAIFQSDKENRAAITRLLNGDRKLKLEEVEHAAEYLAVSNIEILYRFGMKLSKADFDFVRMMDIQH